MAVAVYMAEHGAKHFILMGRTMPTSPKTLRMLSKIKALGASYNIILGDVSKMEVCIINEIMMSSIIYHFKGHEKAV